MDVSKKNEVLVIIYTKIKLINYKFIKMSVIEFDENEKKLEKLIEEHKDKPTFVDFNATWCGPCRVLKPKLEQVCKDNDFILISVDVDNNSETTEKYQASGIPFVLLFIEGKKVFEFVGAKQEKLDEAVALAKKK